MPTINISLSLPSGSYSNAFMTFEKETLKYYKRIIAAGGDIDTATLSIVDELVVSAKRDGWWSSVKEAYLFCGTNLAAALCKLVTPDGVATSLVNHGFTEDDYSQRAGFGILTGNHISHKWLETGFVPGDHGLSMGGIGLLVANTDDNISFSDDSGFALGDLTPATSGLPNLGWRPSKLSTLLGISSAAYTWTNCCARVQSLQTSGSYISVVTDGVKQVGYSNSSSGAIGEIGLFKSICFSDARYGNGKLGAVFLTSYLSETLSVAATKAIALFERKIRGCYGNECIAWGDSIWCHQTTSAVGLSAPSIAARFLGLRECNLGNPGQSFTIHNDRPKGSEQVNDLLELPARTVIMSFGTNDGVNSVTDTNYATELDTVLTALKAAGKKVVICSPCYSTNSTYNTTVQRQYAVKCAAKALSYGLIFADTNRAIADQPTPTDFMDDSLHPNDAGHKVMGERIIAALNGRQERQVTLDLGSFSAGATATQTVEVLTARVGQTVQLGLPATVDSGLIFDARVTGDDTVTIRYTNITGGSIDPASAVYRIAVIN